MTDPLDVLRGPTGPVEPDPGFATRLRARLERALADPRGAAVTTTAADHPDTPAADVPVAGVVPYLAVADAAAALDWYVEAFGARRRGEPIVMPDGRIGHAEVELAGTVVMLADAHPEIGVAAPVPGEPVICSLHVTVPDVDAAFARAVGAGASAERTPADYPYGRNAVVRDPFGHRWMLASEAPAPRVGDLAYVSLWVPDVARAAAFYGSVLGWRYEPASGPEGRRVEGATPHHGLWGGETDHTLFCCFTVDDVAAAVERVRAAGGEADEPVLEPYGWIAECVDDQGTRFALHQSVPGETGDRLPPNGAHSGDLAYVTLEVVDAAKARAFYGVVLGWRFEPGRVADGWSVVDVRPMVGVHGGHEAATAVPMYRVDDVAEAVARVHAAGGTATDPTRQPYGVTSECTDDQGTRFLLGQL